MDADEKFKKRLVDDVMNPVTLFQIAKTTIEETVDKAFRTMKESEKGKLVVYEGNEPKYVLKLNIIAGEDGDRLIKEFLPQLEDVYFTHRGVEFDKIRDEVLAHPLTLVMGDYKQPVGIVTASDIIRYWENRKDN